MSNDDATIRATLERLRSDHRAADERLKQLAAHLSLSPDEQMELARLKKTKLQLKDEMRRLGA